jgi:hypothetical protein
MRDWEIKKLNLSISFPKGQLMITMTPFKIESDQLALYCQRRFDWQRVAYPLTFPMNDEPSVAAWAGYAKEASRESCFTALQSRLVQLQFPVEAGISQKNEYRLATRQGASTIGMSMATGISILAPEQIELLIYKGVAGALPILIIGNRTDFETMVQALRWRNEPEPIPPSMGACMIAGYNNWDRIRAYQRTWQAANPLGNWQSEFRALLPQKARYQDRFMLVSKGAYSAVSTKSVQMDTVKWADISTRIRIEHEYTHYLTVRLFNDMQNHMLDELLADYAGLVAAVGTFDLSLFFHFLGLENYPQFRPSGRMQNYRGTPPLSDADFVQLQQLVIQAAQHVSQFSRQTSQPHLINVLTLTQFSLAELAGETAVSKLISTPKKLMTSKEVILNGSNK